MEDVGMLITAVDNKIAAIILVIIVASAGVVDAAAIEARLDDFFGAFDTLNKV